jgi:hypothetical protein
MVFPDSVSATMNLTHEVTRKSIEKKNATIKDWDSNRDVWKLHKKKTNDL